MAEKIRIGILGYGNLGKGVELAIRQNPDMELAAFFTRRAPEALKTQSPDVPVYNVKDAISKKDDIDVMILCGGSATDLYRALNMQNISTSWTALIPTQKFLSISQM